MDFQYDSDGFLVGQRLSADEFTDELRAILDSLGDIETAVLSIERLMKAAGLSAPKSAEAKTVAEPITRRATEKKAEVGRRSSGDNTEQQQSAKRESIAKNRTRANQLATPPARVASDEIDSRKPSAGRENASTYSSSRRNDEPRRDVEEAPPRRDSERGRGNGNEGKSRDVAVTTSSGVTNLQGGVAPEVVKSTVATPSIRRAKSIEPNKTPIRDEKGRFIGSKKANANDPYISDFAKENRSATLLAEKLAEAVIDGTESIGDADPTVRAMNEIAQPVSRGFEMVKNAWGDSEESGWLRKILKSIGSFRKEQSVFNKAQKKVLTNIDENTDRRDVGRADSGFLANTPVLGGLLAKFGGIAGALAVVAKRIPIIGGLLAGAKGIFDVFNSEWDSTLSREEKDKKTGAAVGKAGGAIGLGLVGAKTGAMAGAFAGPIGAAIGSAVGGAAGLFFGSKAGDILGQAVGSWVADLRSADIAGMISETWSSLTSHVTETWDKSIAGVSEFWNKAADGATKQLEAVNDWIKEKTGIDVGSAFNSAISAVSSAWKRASNFVSGGNARVSAKVGGSIDDARSYTTAAIDPLKWQLGQTSANFESGGSGAETISSGRGDFGGKSYGTFQLSSRTGTLQNFLSKSGYASKFEGVKVGSTEFDAKWKELAKSDPQFASAQHEYIKATHYDKAHQGLAETGIDLSGRGKAVQDMLWSTSVQFGAGKVGSMSGAVGMINQALAGRDISKMSDAEIVSAVQDYKLVNNDRLFRSSSAEVRRGTARRASLEKQRLLTLDAVERAKGPIVEQTVLENAGLRRKQTLGDGMLGGEREETPLPQNDVVGPTIANAERLRARKDADAKARTRDTALRADFISKSVEDVSLSSAESASVSASRDRSRSIVSEGGVIDSRWEAKEALRYKQTPQVGERLPKPVPAPVSAAPIQTPMASNDKQKAPVVKIETEATQDVRDRAIAHIVTGGLSGAD